MLSNNHEIFMKLKLALDPREEVQLKLVAGTHAKAEVLKLSACKAASSVPLER